MAQERQSEYAKSDAPCQPSGNRPLNVRAVEEAIAAGLAKIPVVKKVLCHNDGSTFDLTIVHDSPDNGDAVEIISRCMANIEYKVIRSGDAPDDVYMNEVILDESDGHSYGSWGEKTLFERK